MVQTSKDGGIKNLTRDQVNQIIEILSNREVA